MNGLLSDWLQQYWNRQFLLAALFGLVILVFLAVQRFNRPTYPTKGLGPVATLEPAQLTTADRSRLGLLVYLVLLLLLYVLLCGLGPQVAALIGITAGADMAEKTPWAWPIIAATLVVGVSVADDDNFLGRLEHVFRKRGHELALVPLGVQRLAEVLAKADVSGLEADPETSEEAALFLSGAEADAAAGAAPNRRRRELVKLWRHTVMLISAINAAGRSDSIAAEFRAERDAELADLESFRSMLAEPVQRSLAGREEVPQKLFDDVAQLHRRAALLLASGLLYHKRSQADHQEAIRRLGIVVPTISTRVGVLPSIVPIYLAGLLAAAFLVFIVVFRAVPLLYPAAADDDAPLRGVLLAASGFVIYLSVGLLTSALRDKRIERGEWAEKPLGRLAFALLAGAGAAILPMMFGFILTPELTTPTLVSLTTIAGQCLIGALFMVCWHLPQAAQVPALGGWFRTIAHLAIHAMTATLFALLMVQMVLDAPQCARILSSARNAGTTIEANGVPATAADARRAVLARALAQLRHESDAAADRAEGRIMLPARAELGREADQLSQACRQVNAALATWAPLGANLEPPPQGVRPECLLANLDLPGIALPDDVRAVIAAVQRPVLELQALLSELSVGLQNSDSIARQANEVAILLSTFLFAGAFSLLTLRGRAMQLRENDALPELERAYSDKAGFAAWLTTPLRDVPGVPRGMTPLEAAAYDATRRAVLAQLQTDAADGRARLSP